MGRRKGHAVSFALRTATPALLALVLALGVLVASAEPMPVLAGSFASRTTYHDLYGDVASVSRLWRDATYPRVHALDEGPTDYGASGPTWSTDIWMIWGPETTDMYRLASNSLIGLVDSCKKTHTEDEFYYYMPYDTDSNAYRTCTLTQLDRTQSPEPRAACTAEQLPWAAEDPWAETFVDAVDVWVSECNSSDAYSLSSTRNTYEFWAVGDDLRLPKSVEVNFRYFVPRYAQGIWTLESETTQVVTWDCFVQGVPDADAFEPAPVCFIPSPSASPTGSTVPSSLPSSSAMASNSVSPTATPTS